MAWTEPARLLLRKARQDQVIVSRAVDDAEIAEEIVGFHVQQACEKCMKAVLCIRAMTIMTIPEAQAHLPEIVENLKPGEEVILTSNEQPAAKLIPISTAKPQPVFGNSRGKLIIVAEDEEHIKDFSDYMP
jgi:antitoxin (DNA-binding transcriptional repressor) of toxin-antitoxin stability system